MVNDIRVHGPDMAAELLKLLRGRWLTRHGIKRELNMSEVTVRRWVLAMHDNGLLIDRPAEVKRGPVATDVREYTVAPAWMGEQR